MRQGLVVAAILCAAAVCPQASRDLELAKRVEPLRLRADLQTIASFGSRLAGSAGEAATLDWAAARLRSLGFTGIEKQPFEVAVPDPEAQARWDVDAPIAPLWPNLVTTSTCDIVGPVLDGRALDGRQVAGAIVLLPFGSGAAWRQAARLRAGALVFYDDGRINRAEAEQKLAESPIRVPRFFTTANFDRLRPALGRRVGIQCRQAWVRRKSANLIATLPGRRAETVLFSAFVDAMSIVPSMAPGAQQSCGLVALLEGLRIVATQPRERSLRVVIHGSHGLGLRGSREYVRSWLTETGGPIAAGLTLDLSTGGRTMGVFGSGWFNEARDDTRAIVGPLARVMRERAERTWKSLGLRDAREYVVDAINQSDGLPWKNSIPGKFALDCEPYLLAQAPVVTLATADDERERSDTPTDRLEHLDLDSLVSQVERATIIMKHLAIDPGPDWGPVDPESTDRVPTRPTRPRSMSLFCGFGSVEGRTLVYDPSRGFVPSVPVLDAAVVLAGRHACLMGVRGDLVALSRGDGGFQFDGLAVANSYLPAKRLPMSLAAFQLDTAGSIAMAPAEGLMGSADYPTRFLLNTTKRSSPLVLFRCNGFDVIGAADPQSMAPIQRIEVLDLQTHGEPPQYGLYTREHDRSDASSGESDFSIFVPRRGDGEAPAGLTLIGRSLEGELRMLLVNGGSKDLRFPDLVSASSLLDLDRERIERLSRHQVINVGVGKLEADARAEVDLAKDAVRNAKWSAAERHARAAAGIALRSYPIVRGTANDVVNGVIYYLFLLIPFSYCAERLFIASRSLSGRVGWSLLVFFVAFLILRVIHPAFEIVPNPWIVFVAFVMAGLSVFVSAFLLGKFDSGMTRAHAAGLGLRESDIKRSGAASAAFQVGIATMRRRPMRTGLTIFTLTVMTFIALSVTSVVPEVAVNRLDTGRTAPYDGALVRNPDMGPLGPTMRQSFSNEFDGRAQVLRRCAFYGSEPSDTTTFRIFGPGGSTEAKAILGLDSGEPLLSPTLSAGRAFLPGETGTILLPEPMAQTLGVGVGARVLLFGRSREVVGLIAPKAAAERRDMDGDGLMPPDFTTSRRRQQETGSATSAFLSFQRFDPAVCAILPSDDVLGLGGTVRSMAIVANPGVELGIDQLVRRMRVNLYASAAGVVRQFSAIPRSRAAGLGIAIIQMLIASLFVLNTMIASVQERKREIGVLSSIGFSPGHIATLFFAESAVYGVLGAVFGYFGVQAVSKLALSTGWLPGLTVDFSSSSAVFASLIVMGAVMVSTVYPAKVAAQIAAPARDRSLLREPPEGDAWSIELPFTVSEREAPEAIASFFAWLLAHERFTMGKFVSEDTRVDGLRLESVVWLAPFDLGVSQRLSIEASPSAAPGAWELHLHLTRLSGEPRNWARANGAFFESVRRQFLTWQTSERPRAKG